MSEKQTNGDNLNYLVGQCEDCSGTGWYGDNVPGIPGNSEFCRCECGIAPKCTAGWHKYRLIGGVPWCDECGLEADLSVCKLTHVLPDEERNSVIDNTLQRQAKQDFCEWSCGDEDCGYWNTCGNEWILMEGTPADNGMNFCPICGKKLIVG